MQRDGCFVEIYVTVGGVKAAVNKDLIDKIITYARFGYGEFG
jgi:Na+/pantothenate symporter